MKLANSEKCCGCGVCEIVCPFDAIKMKYDEEGFLYPIVKQEFCKECGKCEKACPILNKEKIQIKSHNRRIAQGFFKDIDKHKASASGGAATAFSEMIISEGGCVFGSIYTKDYKSAKFVKVDNFDELSLLKGSKYIETKKDDIFKEVHQELKMGKKVLFTGLPCDIGALKSYLGKDFDNLYSCELICHGPTAQKVQEHYIECLTKKYKSKVVGFSSRYKLDNTEVAYIKVDFENGKSYKKPLWDTEYGYAFAIYSRPSCYNCSFKGDERVADISVGDSWCAGESFGDKKGVSIMYAHTDKGMELLNYVEMLDDFIVQELDYKSVENDNPAIRESLERKPERDKFVSELMKHNLKKATLKSKSLKNKVKFIIKSIK